MRKALGEHWPEYFMEAAALGIFMISACLFGVLLEHPASPAYQNIADAGVRRVLAGLAMGLTAISIFYSPWGQRSGAHMNPAVTLSFLWLGKVRRPDAIFYVAAQFIGGAAGVALSALVLGRTLADPRVNYVVTAPGDGGPWTAFAAEAIISFLMMTTVLYTSNSARLSRFTPLFAGALVAVYISIEAPLSGMSMNPARTFGSAMFAQYWQFLWIYFTAPVAAMLFAAWLYRERRGYHRIFCAKLHHHNDKRCIFRCGWGVRDAA